MKGKIDIVKLTIAGIKRYIKERNNTTEEYLIAYFDILGYKNIITKEIIKENELIDIIQELIKKMNKVISIRNVSKFKPKVYCFSDNFLICIKCEGNNFIELVDNLMALVMIMQILQCTLISVHKIFIRGSIIKGKLYCDRNFVYGEGLINAYMLENNVAIYPRILIQKELIDNTIVMCKDIINALYKDKRKIEKITCNNVFDYYRNAICDLLKKCGKINYNTYQSLYNECKRLKIIKDFDGIYFIDYLEYLNYDQNIKEETFLGTTVRKYSLLKSRYINSIDFYWRKFSEDLSVVKKLLWTCNYANQFFVNNGEEKIFDRDHILIKSYADLEKINRRLIDVNNSSENSRLEKEHLSYLITIAENL